MSRLGFFGPRGTFTEQALLSMPIAGDAELIDYKTVAATLDGVRCGEVDAALVPFENSVEGSVSATLDELAYGEPLVIVDEVALRVEFALMVRPGTELSDITLYTTHPHAYAQCRDWLAAALPDAHFSPALSNASAAVEVADPASRFQAAIGPRIAAEHYGLDIIADNIGDNEAAHTRFILVSQRRQPAPPTGADCTTLVIFIRQDHAGALLEILNEFAVRGINLTRIESRPTKKQLGDYYFSLDIQGHIGEARVREALAGLHRICLEVRYLGSYPRHDGRANLAPETASDEAFAESMEWIDALREHGRPPEQ
ncbi:MAG: prephenate dehydratase [Candidatus Nanopelagicales bacterium]